VGIHGSNADLRMRLSKIAPAEIGVPQVRAISRQRATLVPSPQLPGGHGWGRGHSHWAFGWSQGRKVGWRGRGCPPGMEAGPLLKKSKVRHRSTSVAAFCCRLLPRTKISDRYKFRPADSPAGFFFTICRPSLSVQQLGVVRGLRRCLDGDGLERPAVRFGAAVRRTLWDNDKIARLHLHFLVAEPDRPVPSRMYCISLR
jgi:hypothetical protein